MADWHPEDIKARIRRRGVGLVDLDRKAGLCRRATAHALTMPHANAEAAIAEFLGVPAHVIWPSRYHPDGRRKKPQPRANYKPAARFRHARGEAA